MIIQLFQNLIGNAVKYSSLSQHPTITIEAELYEENYILYKISDNGIGFEMKEADKIFDLFHRLDNVKNIDGTGVGLAIVKRLVEKNGGKIWAESVVNSGTVFFITLMKEIRLLPSVVNELAYA
jgi:chemotaxis family two-component system sensor kinase Cph1